MPYAPAVVERTMKVPEVLRQAISGRLTWLEAEDILGWRPRTLRRAGATACAAMTGCGIGAASGLPRGAPRSPRSHAPAFVPLGKVDLTHVRCHEETRTVAPGNTLSLEGVRLPMDKQPGPRTCEGPRVLGRRHLDGGPCIWRGARCFGHHAARDQRRPAGAPAPPPLSPAVPPPEPGADRLRVALESSPAPAAPAGPRSPRRRALVPA
jgi:hypothetical protein